MAYSYVNPRADDTPDQDYASQTAQFASQISPYTDSPTPIPNAPPGVKITPGTGPAVTQNPSGAPPPGGGGPAPTASAPTSTAQNDATAQQYFNQLFPGSYLSPEMLTQNEASLAQQGISLVRNAAGTPGKIKLPSGKVIDVILGAGAGTNQKQWLDTSGAAGSPMVTGSGGIPPGYAFNPTLIGQQDAAMTQAFSPLVSPEMQNQMNEVQKETIARGGEAAMHQFNQNAAGRGVFGGGTAEMQRQKLLDQTLQNQLTSQRDIALQVPQLNRNALLAALSGSQSILGPRAQLGYAYDMGNAGLEQQFINSILNSSRE